MQPIVYDVAVSADGLICGARADVSRFPHDGPVVDDYRARLAGYGTVLMGRATYEFGYDYGLPPGANPYPGMRAVVISSSISLPDGAEVELHRDLSRLAGLKAEADRPLYLCGGGVLAGALLRARLIDEVILKRAPILLGTGVPLWSGGAPVQAELIEDRDYGEGRSLQRYRL